MAPKSPGERFNDHIGSVVVIKKLSDSDKALKLLRQAANIVSPLLERRKWKIKVLTEFFPANESLLGLNVNKGHTVKVRLREGSNESTFFNLDHILGTLIHEITHISISPHSAEFYRLMETLMAEVEKDMAAGVDLEGNPRFAAFTGVSRQLGCSSGSTNPHSQIGLSANQLRKARVGYLAKRERVLSLSTGSGSKLGSASSSVDLDPVEVKRRRLLAMSEKVRSAPINQIPFHADAAISSSSSSNAVAGATFRLTRDCPSASSAGPVVVLDDEDSHCLDENSKNSGVYKYNDDDDDDEVIPMWLCRGCESWNEEGGGDSCGRCSLIRGSGCAEEGKDEVSICSRCTLVNEWRAVMCAVCGTRLQAIQL